MNESIESRSSEGLVRATPIVWDETRHYAVTLTFKPTLELPQSKTYTRSVLDAHIVESRVIKTRLKKHSPKKQFLLTESAIRKMLDKEDMEYDFYAEYHWNGQIHFHGIVGHKTMYGSLIQSTLLYLFNRHFGLPTVKELKDPKGWFDYCTKDKSCSLLHFTSNDETN